MAEANPTDQASTGAEAPEAPEAVGKRKPKPFNLYTYKNHSLGDYVEAIAQFGTTDLYSTEPGELEHRNAKSRYKRTSRKEYVRQVARIERRQTRLRRLRALNRLDNQTEEMAGLQFPEAHHYIGKSQNEFDHIGEFLLTHSEDPAVKDFLPKLKKHLLPRVLEILRTEVAERGMGIPNVQVMALPNPNRDSESLFFRSDRLYKHRTLRINYTTYDVRRGQDVINPRTSHRDIMVLADTESNAESERFLYARILGIYHANVVYTGAGMLDYEPRRMEFLWVRWFHAVDPQETGFSSRRLDTVKFFPMAHGDAFGFLDPKDVLRACHIIPKMLLGKVHLDGIGMSRSARDVDDWHFYYVNRFVDRDMMMRYYWGLGVGHVYAHISADPRLRFPIVQVTLPDMQSHPTDDVQRYPTVDDVQPHPMDEDPVNHPGVLNGLYVLVGPQPIDGAMLEEPLEDPELGMEDRETDEWYDSDLSDGAKSSEDGSEDSDDAISLES
ncbi:hypothetical protein Hypma_009822 [Hypsizygus marmoreus]|uniref:Uncharacterized protein n=1 Tax=Hypsizygus marmoreus TaxID=39966 RepID=A0A369JNI3_HYPMA|nr:hypothetical protein Hypma_009822 [Hypsizygus marmoreus]